MGRAGTGEADRQQGRLRARHRWLPLPTVAALLFGSAPATAAPREWLFASLAPEGSPTAGMLDDFVRLFEKHVKGNVRLQRRYGGVLGDEVDMLASCRLGKIAFWAGSLGSVIPTVPELRFLEIPYLFQDISGFQRVVGHYRRGLHPQLQGLFARRGLVLLGAAAIGWRNFSSVKRPIRTVADLRGMTIRAQPSDLHPVYLSAFGARPKSISLNEINTALDVELIEGFDIMATIMYAGSLDSRIKHYTVSRHVLQIGLAVAHRATWETLSPQERKAIEEGLEGVLTRGERAHMAFDDELVALLPKRGVSVVHPTPEALGAFRAAARKVEEHVRRTGSKEEIQLLDSVKALLADKNADAR